VSADVRPLLVLDTATRTPVVAIASLAGAVLGERRWTSRHRHGEELLGQLDGLLAELDLVRTSIAGVIVGTGPGSFTGLRIGLATAKLIAYGLAVPLTGISTSRALALAAARHGPDAAVYAVALPAGVADRYVHRLRVAGGRVAELEPAQLVGSQPAFAAAVDEAEVVAVDLEPGQLAPAAIELGRHAIAGLAEALASMGVEELRRGRHDDPASLVPAYVALPRGISQAAASVEWLPDLR
jgi:tRNA threonylcarbamoyladenosine biosynthesis protein TsaB